MALDVLLLPQGAELITVARVQFARKRCLFPIGHPLPADTVMVGLVSNFQSARTGRNFFTGMSMLQYGLTSRWTVGLMFEGQKIFGLPATYGGLRVNSSFRVFPHDHLLNFTVYGEYEGLHEAAL